MTLHNGQRHHARALRVIVIVSGVSGAGKSTVGRLLARRLGWEFVEGDDFHSPANREKMKNGTALTEEERHPWLLALQSAIAERRARGGNAVFAISSLKKQHRALLRADGVRFVFLEVTREEASRRLRNRQGHFFNPRLLDSQFAALERPESAIVMDGGKQPLRIVEGIIARLGLGQSDG